MSALRIALGCAALFLLGCSDASHYSQAVAVLIDVSGTYADQKPEVARIVKREVLPSLVPGDTVLVVRIDSESYEKANVEAFVTLDQRPSHANAQKLALAKQLDAFAARDERSQYTDIPGAMMLSAEYLRETGAKSRADRPVQRHAGRPAAGRQAQVQRARFDGIHVVALNVKRLAADNANLRRAANPHGELGEGSHRCLRRRLADLHGRREARSVPHGDPLAREFLQVGERTHRYSALRRRQQWLRFAGRCG